MASSTPFEFNRLPLVAHVPTGDLCHPRPSHGGARQGHGMARFGHPFRFTMLASFGDRP